MLERFAFHCVFCRLVFPSNAVLMWAYITTVHYLPPLHALPRVARKSNRKRIHRDFIIMKYLNLDLGRGSCSNSTRYLHLMLTVAHTALIGWFSNTDVTQTKSLTRTGSKFLFACSRLHQVTFRQYGIKSSSCNEISCLNWPSHTQNKLNVTYWPFRM